MMARPVDPPHDRPGDRATLGLLIGAWLTRPAQRRAALAALADMELTYPEVGASAGPLPADAYHARRDVAIGDAPGVFEAAASALLGWRMHRRAGFEVLASTTIATVGADMIATLPGRFPIGVSVPTRILAVVDEPDRAGFTFGTLPGHPVRGEERFEVRRGPDGVVRLSIVAFSRPTPGLVTALGPMMRIGQRLITDRFVHAVKVAAAEG
jgi:uncharacterized protein (UPF0548 family)